MAGRMKSQLGEIRERPINDAAPFSFLKCSHRVVPSSAMDDKLTPADPHHFLASLALALTSDGRRAKTQAAELTASIVAERIVARLERDGYVIMGRPPQPGADGYGKSAI
jgi:hypothetical protein